MIFVRGFVGKAPGLRADDGIEDGAWPEQLPRALPALGEEHLPHPPGRQLRAGVANDANADHRDLEIVAVDLAHPTNRALRDAPFADDAVDAGHDLGAVRKRHGEGIEMLEVAKAKVHPGDRQPNPTFARCGLSQTNSSGTAPSCGQTLTMWFSRPSFPEMEPGLHLTKHQEDASLGRVLVDSRDEIIEVWYARWRAEGQPHADVSEAALKDLAPLQLQIIGKALTDGSYRSESPGALWRDYAERLRPEDRIPQSIPIEEVVQEYWLLFSTVRDWLKRKRIHVRFDELTYFYEAIFELVGESVRRYSIRRADVVSQERAEYLASLAHQMRGPLTVLTIGVARLQASPTTRDDERLLASLQRNLARLTTQVAGVLRLERYKGEELPVRVEPVFPGMLIENVVCDVQDEAASKGLTLLANVSNGVRMDADPELLTDALFNLVHNAVKYTERGSVQIDLTESADAISFRVTDTGPGISLARQRTLFQPVHPDKRGGFGLGLAVAQRVVTAQGGRIGVETELGKGTSFFFTLPRRVRSRT